MGYKILVADDDALLRDFYKYFLEFEGYKVIMAQNGLEAVKIYDSDEEPDAVIMDYEMPIKNGIEALREIMDIDADKPPKVIMCTGRVYNGCGNLMENIAMQSGAVAFFNKPIPPNALIECLESLLPKKIPYSLIPPTPIPNSVGYDSYSSEV